MKFTIIVSFCLVTKLLLTRSERTYRLFSNERIRK